MGFLLLLAYVPEREELTYNYGLLLHLLLLLPVRREVLHDLEVRSAPTPTASAITSTPYPPVKLLLISYHLREYASRDPATRISQIHEFLSCTGM